MGMSTILFILCEHTSSAPASSTTGGKGCVGEDLECRLYKKFFEVGHVQLQLPRAKQLLAMIDKNFSTLALKLLRWRFKSLLDAYKDVLREFDLEIERAF